MQSFASLPLAAGTAALLLGFVFVGIILRMASSWSLLDVPNFRSSHKAPTARGGGAGLVAAAIVVLVIAAEQIEIEWTLLAALLGVAVTAAAGWADDRKHLAVRTRLAAHLFSGLCLLPLAFHGGSFGLAVIGLLGAWWIFATVSAINVANFMDGIDGLIGLQFVLLGAHFALLSVTREGLLFSLVLCGATAGFLLWNWHPAKIFLGDAGSGALGVLGIIGAILALRGGSPFLVVFLPLYPLCLDAVVTMLRRWARGENVTVAHREHLYQRLAHAGWGHAKVTMLFGLAAAAGSAIGRVAAGPAFYCAAMAYAVAVLLAGMALDRGVTKTLAVQRV
jgi:UDP-N-acetylmuramyl pentapeptide phosphotransferase/UDP-N-acetylglucosamine-1-phosphate transferase